MSSAAAFSHVEWDPERFGIGIRQIDEQHKLLISIINRLSNAVQVAYNAHMARKAAREKINTTSATVPLPSSSASGPDCSPARASTAASTAASVHASPRGAGGTAAGAAYNKVRMANSQQSSPIRGGGAASPTSATAAHQQASQSEAVEASNAALMAETCRMAQEPVDMYTPASHLRAFPSCYQQGSTVGDCLGDLVGYCLRSLAAEDHILETYSYPDRATQMQEHEAFGEQVCRYHKLCEEYALEEEDLLHLLTFLKLWVKDHIPRDRRYAPLLLEKGIGV